MTLQTSDLARQLSEWLNGSDITLLELSGPGTLIRLRRDVAGESIAPATPQAPEARETQAQPKTTTVVRAGSVGVVLHAHPLRQDPLVREGQRVVAGQAVALLKIGAVLLGVPAPRAGVVARVVAADGSHAGWGDPLAEIE